MNTHTKDHHDCQACLDEATHDTWEESYDKNIGSFADLYHSKRVNEVVKNFIRSLLAQQRADIVEKLEKSMKKSPYGAPLCRSCQWTMVKSTGLGKVAFPWQCPNCNNYQEDMDDTVTLHNTALSDAIQLISKE